MPNVSWEDIGGLENVKRELQEVIEFYYLVLMHSYTLLSSSLGGLSSLFLFHIM